MSNYLENNNIEDLEELYTKNIILELLNKKETENEDTTN